MSFSFTFSVEDSSVVNRVNMSFKVVVLFASVLCFIEAKPMPEVSQEEAAASCNDQDINDLAKCSRNYPQSVNALLNLMTESQRRAEEGLIKADKLYAYNQTIGDQSKSTSFYIPLLHWTRETNKIFKLWRAAYENCIKTQTFHCSGGKTETALDEKNLKAAHPSLERVINAFNKAVEKHLTHLYSGGSPPAGYCEKRTLCMDMRSSTRETYKLLKAIAGKLPEVDLSAVAEALEKFE